MYRKLSRPLFSHIFSFYSSEMPSGKYYTMTFFHPKNTNFYRPGNTTKSQLIFLILNKNSFCIDTQNLCPGNTNRDYFSNFLHKIIVFTVREIPQVQTFFNKKQSKLLFFYCKTRVREILID